MDIPMADRKTTPSVLAEQLRWMARWARERESHDAAGWFQNAAGYIELSIREKGHG